ncbi:MAG: hypothetical protein OXI37_03590 [Gammaproteobacteria bacterium]|nr:hypothetical protein [Gammaproteobacteria bacterium]
MKWTIPVIIMLAMTGTIALAPIWPWAEDCELGLTDVRELEPQEGEIFRQEFRIVCCDPEIECATADPVKTR